MNLPRATKIFSRFFKYVLKACLKSLDSISELINSNGVFVCETGYGGFFVFLVILCLIVVKAIVRIAVRIRYGVRGVAVAGACIGIE